jgi:hypothetical protein
LTNFNGSRIAKLKGSGGIYTKNPRKITNNNTRGVLFMALTTLEGARKELAALMRKTKDDKIDHQKARLLTYMFSHLLAYFKTEQDQEIIRRLEILEEQQNRQTVGGLCTRREK